MEELNKEVRQRAPRLRRQSSLQYYWGPGGLLLIKDGVRDNAYRHNDDRRSKDDSCVVRSGRFMSSKSGGTEAIINALREEGESPASAPSSSSSSSWAPSLASSSLTPSLPSSSSLSPLMNKSSAGEAVMREEGGAIPSSASWSSCLSMSMSLSASTCFHEVLERRRSDDDRDDYNNDDTSRLQAIPVNVITARLLELLQKTTEQRRQVARLIRSIDPSIPIERWHQHDHHEYHQYSPDHDYRPYDHHHKEEEEEEEGEEEASKTWRSTASSDNDDSSQYNNNDALIFLRHKVSQLRRQVALLTHDLLAAKARNRLLQGQLLHSFLPTHASSSYSAIDPPLQPPLLVDEIKDMKYSSLMVEKIRKCSSLSGEDGGEEVLQ